MDYYCGKCGTEFDIASARTTRGLCPFCGVPLDPVPPARAPETIDVAAEPVGGGNPSEPAPPADGTPMPPAERIPPPVDDVFWYWRGETAPRSSCGCCGCLPLFLLFLLLALLMT